jgi:quercetin dioxygenase-like cupin family protein/DNA-binding XRE family transcriptional regulator
MTDQLQEMGRRIKALREIEDISPETMAKKCEVTQEEYVQYEAGSKDFSFSFLYNAANALGVDVVDLMSGDSPKLSTCSMVKKGGGFEVKRREAYNYKHLAFTFRNKMAEPFMVTVEPKDDKPVTLHSHDGQEFNYVVDGQMTFYIGDISYDLGEGDSVYFDSGIPHAMKAENGLPCKFLAVVLKKEK